MVDGDQIETWLANQGFINIRRHRTKWPLNDWPRDKHYKEIGSLCFHNIDHGLEGLLLALFTRVLGWSKEETLLFCSRVRKQLRDRRTHAYSPVDVVYAQKPPSVPAAAPEEAAAPAPAPAAGEGDATN